MGQQLGGRITRLEHLRGVNGGPPKIIVCWHMSDDECDCIGRDDDIIIQVRYEDNPKPADLDQWA